tara:strand:+ start:587 stop:1105 length:519 start_codon:yes stop_codon:yes gene_type:complete
MPQQYNNSPIEDDDINLILEAANWAPTHKKTEPWRYKVLTNKTKDKFGEFLGKKYKESTLNFSDFKYNSLIEKTKKSSVIILICMQRDPNESVPEWEEIASVSMSVQNMWLMATDLNIGAYWSSTKLIEYIDEFIPLDKGENCLGIFYMGKYDKEKFTRNPKPIDEKIKWFR